MRMLLKASIPTDEGNARFKDGSMKQVATSPREPRRYRENQVSGATYFPLPVIIPDKTLAFKIQTTQLTFLQKKHSLLH